MNAQQIELFRSTDTPEWYTPDHIIYSVIDMWGTIDLDPCSDAEHNVPATTHLTKDDDGLSHTWSGRVFCNPPYGRTINKWIYKLEQEYNSGNVKEGILLVFANTDTNWFNDIAHHTVCFVRGRLRFKSPSNGSSNAAMRPSMVVYFGKDDSKFIEVFSKVGNVYRNIR